MLQTLGQPPVDTLLDASGGTVDISDHIAWVIWFNEIFNVLINVGPQYRVAATLDFPNTASGTSSDLDIVVPGALPSMQVSLGAPIPAAGSFYTAYAGTDRVTVRFANFSGAPINPGSGEFRVAVHTGEQT